MSWVNSGAVAISGSTQAMKVRSISGLLTRAPRAAPGDAPTNGAMASHAATSTPTPMSTSALEASIMRPISAPKGKFCHGFSTTGRAPPPMPAKPIRNAPTAPAQRSAAKRPRSRARTAALVGALCAGEAGSCSSVERDPGRPKRGSSLATFTRGARRARREPCGRSGAVTVEQSKARPDTGPPGAAGIFTTH